MSNPAMWAEAIRRFVAGAREWEWLDEEFDEDPLGHVVLGPERDAEWGLQAIVGSDEERGWHLFIIDIDSGEDVCDPQEHLHSRRAAMKRGETEIVRLVRQRLVEMLKEQCDGALAP